MSVDLLARFFLWCSIINAGLLIFVFLLIKVAHGWIYSIHGRWFSVTEEQFDQIIYRMMLSYKTGLFIFNLVPYVALRIIM
ncbi:MAG: hypothetical protein JW746_06440 [Candidatus Krumholzibacteriota bacterium]|nr:hypothetical protein [Candidatus Krumholzibacteriota bacterium]